MRTRPEARRKPARTIGPGGLWGPPDFRPALLPPVEQFSNFPPRVTPPDSIPSTFFVIFERAALYHFWLVGRLVGSRDGN